MNQFDKILNSSNPSDALLGEQIDKLGKQWQEINLPLLAESADWIGDQTIKQYYNPILRKVVVTFYGRFRKSANADTSIDLANLTSSNLAPISAVRAYAITSTFNLRMMCNQNATTIGFKVITGTVASNSVVGISLEWSVI